ncbi:MAG: hypothetical protein VW985_05920, partial [Gammaproteobacteria bacterium]
MLLLFISSMAIAESTQPAAATPSLGEESRPGSLSASPVEPPSPVNDETTGPNIDPVSTLPTELSAMQMFHDADWVVKSVMLLLIAASVMTWTIAIAKSIELTRYRKLLLNQNDRLGQSGTLASAGGDQALSVGSAAQMV